MKKNKEKETRRKKKSSEQFNLSETLELSRNDRR
jgi:hypothetical protein